MIHQKDDEVDSIALPWSRRGRRGRRGEEKEKKNNEEEEEERKRGDRQRERGGMEKRVRHVRANATIYAKEVTD